MLDIGFNQLTSLNLPDGLTSLSWLNVVINPIDHFAVPIWMDLNELELLGFPKEEVVFHAGTLKTQGCEMQWTEGTLQLAPTLGGPWFD